MRQFAISLKDVCKINVKIGFNYEEIKPGTIYLSPGDKHMQVTVKNDKPCIRTFEGEPVNFCRPSEDVLFYSTARGYKEKVLGILLTGMGADGVEGLKAIKSYGGKTSVCVNYNGKPYSESQADVRRILGEENLDYLQAHCYNEHVIHACDGKPEVDMYPPWKIAKQ